MKLSLPLDPFDKMTDETFDWYITYEIKKLNLSFTLYLNCFLLFGKTLDITTIPLRNKQTSHTQSIRV